MMVKGKDVMSGETRATWVSTLSTVRRAAPLAGAGAWHPEVSRACMPSSLQLWATGPNWCEACGLSRLPRCRPGAPCRRSAALSRTTATTTLQAASSERGHSRGASCQGCHPPRGEVYADSVRLSRAHGSSGGAEVETDCWAQDPQFVTPASSNQCPQPLSLVAGKISQRVLTSVQ